MRRGRKGRGKAGKRPINTTMMNNGNAANSGGRGKGKKRGRGRY